MIAGGSSRACVWEKWYGESLYGGDMNATLLGIHCEVSLKSTGEDLGKEGQDTCVLPFLSVLLLKTCVHQPLERFYLCWKGHLNLRMHKQGKIWFSDFFPKHYLIYLLVIGSEMNLFIIIKSLWITPKLWFVTMSVFCCFWKNTILYL